MHHRQQLSDLDITSLSSMNSYLNRTELLVDHSVKKIESSVKRLEEKADTLTDEVREELQNVRKSLLPVIKAIKEATPLYRRGDKDMQHFVGNNNFFEGLPNEIMHHILKKLSVHDLITLLGVSLRLQQIALNIKVEPTCVYFPSTHLIFKLSSAKKLMRLLHRRIDDGEVERVNAELASFKADHSVSFQNYMFNTKDINGIAGLIRVTLVPISVLLAISSVVTAGAGFCGYYSVGDLKMDKQLFDRLVIASVGLLLSSVAIMMAAWMTKKIKRPSHKYSI